MKKIGIFYGSTTGTTAAVARKIAAALGVAEADVHNVADSAPADVAPYDLIVLGASTWGSGDVEDEMADFLHGLDVLDLTGKEIAVFGCGDETMANTFCNAVGTIYEQVSRTGARMIGGFGTVGYDFKYSTAVPENAAEAVGLLIDDVNHPEMTDRRIADWAAQLRKEA